MVLPKGPTREPSCTDTSIAPRRATGCPRRCKRLERKCLKCYVSLVVRELHIPAGGPNLQTSYYPTASNTAARQVKPSSVVSLSLDAHRPDGMFNVKLF